MIGMLAKGSTTCDKTSLGSVEKRIRQRHHHSYAFHYFLSTYLMTYPVQAIEAIGMPSTRWTFIR